MPPFSGRQTGLGEQDADALFVKVVKVVRQRALNLDAGCHLTEATRGPRCNHREAGWVNLQQSGCWASKYLLTAAQLFQPKPLPLFQFGPLRRCLGGFSLGFFLLAQAVQP